MSLVTFHPEKTLDPLFNFDSDRFFNLKRNRGQIDEEVNLPKVNVTEDEKVSRKMTIELLKKMGIAKIVASTNGEIALQKLKLQKVDLIISDWHMPIMDRLEFYKAVKKEVDL